MADERFTLAIARIDAAIARIGNVPLPDPPATSPDGIPDLATVGLLERHARLRSGAVETLARLDRLIAVRED